MKQEKIMKKKGIVSFILIAVMFLGCFCINTDRVSAASHLKIQGVDIGFAAGEYFSENGRACTCHKKGICISKPKKCNCILVNNTAQCYAFALWCENKLFGYNDKSQPKKFKNLGSVSAGKLTSSKIKSLINKAPVGAHIRTKGSQHSMILIAKTSKGFTVAQANGSNNKEYKSWKACRIGTSTYTWKSYADSTYGKRGIAFIKFPKNYKIKGETKLTSAPTVKSDKKTYASGSNAKISWNKVSNATKYTLNITGPNNYKVSKTVSANSSYTAKALKKGTYTATVTASNSSSKKTGKCSFSVKAMVETAPTVKANKSSYTEGDTAVFSWNNVTNATKYTLKITGPGGYSVSKTVSANSSYTIKSLKNGKYTASVTAANTDSKKTGSRTIVVNYLTNKIYPAGKQTVSDGVYHIVSNLDSTMTLNIKSASKENGANVQLWNTLNSAKQAFQITYLNNGYYKITNVNSGKSLDVKSGGTTPKTNVQQWSYSGTDNQQWVIKMTNDGSFNIISKHNSLYLDVEGAKTANGTNVQLYTNNGNDAQKWRFVAYGGSTGKTASDGTYHIVSALDNTKNLDVKSVSKDNGANIQLWATQHDPKQGFKVTYLGNGYYKIINSNSGKSLDVKSKGVASGTNVQQWSYSGTDNQQWIIKSAGSGYYYIIAKNSGLYLDAAGGKSANGTNVQVYLGNGTASQKWKLVKVK